MAVMAFTSPEGNKEPEGERPSEMPAPVSHAPLPYLKAWRLHRLMTVRGLAEQAGVSTSTVGWAERGKPASAATAIRLARALEVSVRQLKEEQPAD